MKIPIISGIYTDENSDFRTAYPNNLEPVAMEQGISKGYLRPAPGIIAWDNPGPGFVRGGINWEGVCYRVMGNQLVRIDEDQTITNLGNVGNDNKFVTMDYSFDRLSITSNGNLYYYDTATGLTQVTDADLGVSLDHIWVDGYFMSTDGEYLVVTDLGDPYAVNPLKYGSSELDPDPILAILKVRNEPHAINRYTIEAFDNIGGDLFPFQRIDGAQIQRGAVGTKACCVFNDVIAFVGSGRNESYSVYFAASGSTQRIATREIDLILCQYTETQLSEMLVEAKIDKGHQQLFLHLPDKTLVYDHGVSQALGISVWFTLSSELVGIGAYRGRCLVWCYSKWLIGDTITANVGELTESSYRS